MLGVWGSRFEEVLKMKRVDNKEQLWPRDLQKQQMMMSIIDYLFALHRLKSTKKIAASSSHVVSKWDFVGVDYDDKGKLIENQYYGLEFAHLHAKQGVFCTICNFEVKTLKDAFFAWFMVNGLVVHCGVVHETHNFCSIAAEESFAQSFAERMGRPFDDGFMLSEPLPTSVSEMAWFMIRHSRGMDYALDSDDLFYRAATAIALKIEADVANDGFVW